MEGYFYVFFKNGIVVLFLLDGIFFRFIDSLFENSVVIVFCFFVNERYVIGCCEGVILICDKNGNIW